MLAVRRRWQSIDFKLPLLASGLVVLTALVLAVTAHKLLERALIESAGRRLLNSATIVAQLITRPSPSTEAARIADSTFRRFIAGAVREPEVLAALARLAVPADTVRLYAALVDPTGRPLVEYRRDSTRPIPAWPTRAIASAAVRDSFAIGPFEDFGDGVAGASSVRPVRTADADSAVIAYVVETRAVSGRNVARLRAVIGQDVELLLGQPGEGVWTDLHRIAAPPPLPSDRDSIVVHAGGVGGLAPMAGLPWHVWVGQSRHAVLAPARRMLWTILPVGILIALIGAGLTWRLTRGITGRIVQLTDAAENVAADNGDRPMQPTVLMPITADEVARLRYAFERMARRVAERQTLEMQLRHAQKMEAVGRLAGGVAHDFNNLLTAIRSYSDLLLADTPEWDTKRADLLEIRKAADRAAALTSQLLAFSRKQLLQPRVVDTAVVLTELEGMLRRLLSEDAQLSVQIAPGVWPVRVDRGQLEQVIVNLAVNARDAMPNGGTIALTAMNQTLEHPIATRHGEVPVGQYVALSVTDTGVGMDARTQSQVFEPFFTTKPIGQGTGLGLATVHGIVAQSGGYVTIDSELQRGTTFTVYLPRAHDQPGAASLTPSSVAIIPRERGKETVLLVEDEHAVRALSRRVLERAGFRVLEADAPSAALALAQEHAAAIDLVVSDVVMPEMSGPVMVQRIATLCPQARVLFISGYTDDEIIGRGLADPGLLLLPKPFSAQELVERVRQALDQPPPAISARAS